TADLAEAVAGADYLYTDVWLSMGEPPDEWGERIDKLLPYQGNAEGMAATGDPEGQVKHRPPAPHKPETRIGPPVYGEPGARATGGNRRGLRVTRLRRVRPGREPAAHHQGGDGGDHRGHRVRVAAAAGVTVLLAATVCGYEFRWLYQNRQAASGSGGTGK